jgi:HD-GYP domain-containing protein (c-di-GMP phosphodiesterase class II)
MLALADVYDALVSERPYRPATAEQQALDIISSEAGRKFDPKIVEAFFEVIRAKKGLFCPSGGSEHKSVADAEDDRVSITEWG